MCFPGGVVVKNLPADAGDAGNMGSVPQSGRSPGVGNGNSFQYSCLENSIDRGGRLQSMGWLSQIVLNTHVHAHTHSHIPFVHTILQKTLSLREKKLINVFIYFSSYFYKFLFICRM